MKSRPRQRPATRTAQRAVAALSVLALATPALAQSANADDTSQGSVDVNALWDAYGPLADRFEADSAECDAADKLSTSGDRLCRSAAESGMDLAAVLEDILEHDTTLGADDHEAAIDSLLTTQQIVGTLYLDVQECESAATVLQDVADNPWTQSRQRLLDATNTRLAQANACVAGTPQETPQWAQTDDAPRRMSPAPWIVAGSGVAIFVAGVAMAAGPYASHNATVDCWNDPLCDTGLTPAEALDAESARNTARAVSATLYGVGAAAAIGGVTWAIIQMTSEDTPRDSVAFVPTQGGGVVTWGRSW